MQHPDLREKQRAYQREWGATPEGREKTKGYQSRSREKRKVDPAFTINERMSAAIRQSLALGKQGWRWEALVGFALDDLMAHLERQFQPGMTWANRGQWHIDHIVPLASFKYCSPADPEFQAAWALSNLRPLWATENVRKNATRTHLL